MSKPITIRILGDASGLQKALGQAQGGLGKFGKFAGRAALAAGSGVAAGLGVSVKTFADFDAAMTQSLAIMGDVSSSMEKEMSDAARTVAKTTTFSAKEAAESYFFLASAGMDAEQSVAALPQVAAFAQAGMFDMATATDLATDAQSALGLSSDDAGENLKNLTRTTDVFVRANTLANTSVEQIAEAMTSGAGAAAKIVGKDIEETSAVLAAFADRGVKGAEAGTQFGIVMRDLQTKALQNESAFKKAGVAVFDASGEMRHMGDIIGDLEGYLDGMSDAEKKSALLGLGFSDKSVKSIQTLMGASDAIHEYDGALRESTGFTKDVAEKQLQTFNAQVGLMKDRLLDVGISIGSFLAPKLLRLMEIAGDLGSRIMPKLTAAWDAVKPVLQKVGWAIEALADGDLQGFAEVVDNIFGNSGKFVGPIRRAGLTAMRIFQRIRDAISKLIAGFQAEEGRLAKWREKVSAILAQMQETFSAAFEAVSVIVQVAVSLLTDLWDRFGENLVTNLKRHVDIMLGIVENLWKVLEGIFDLITAVLTGKWGKAWDALKQILSGAVGVIKGILHAFINASSNIIGLGMAAISLAWSRVWSGIKSLVGSAVDGIIGALGGMIDWVKGIPGAISGAASGAFDGLWDAFKAALNRIVGAWNRFQLGPWTLPKVSIPGVGDIGGGQLGPWKTPNIPYLAEGAVLREPTLGLMAEYPGARNNPEIVTPEKKMREVVREETAAITAAIRDALLAIPRPEPAVEAPVSIRQEFHGFSTDEVRSLARKGVEEALAAVRQRKRSR